VLYRDRPPGRSTSFVLFDHSFPSRLPTYCPVNDDVPISERRGNVRSSAIRSELCSSVTTFSRVKFGVTVVSSFVCVMVPDVDPRFAMNVYAYVVIQYLVSDVSTLFYMETRAPVPIKWRRIRPSGRTVLDSIRSNSAFVRRRFARSRLN